MAKCFKAVRGGIRTYAWTSARFHAHHLIHYATDSLNMTVDVAAPKIMIHPPILPSDLPWRRQRARS
ncbi:hypothetical protein E2C01_069014 [Portunus trituberculatus]|uniref:Uncharacterized protein n=1 Tax=Portunus trituberculatus TaxID=210409 RepID=A0A5B7HXS6_PORTR|nr:hypothetical protein [Portunus trituberculatus]